MRFIKKIILIPIYIIFSYVLFDLIEAFVLMSYKPFWLPTALLPIFSTFLTLITFWFLDINFLGEKQENKKNNISDWLSFVLAIVVSYIPLVWALSNVYFHIPFPAHRFFIFLYEQRILPIIGGIWIGISIKKLLNC